MSDIQSSIAASYASAFNYPLSISVVDKLSSFKELQSLNFAGIEGHISSNFHGVQDMYEQMAAYSATHPILSRAWAVIVGKVLLNGAVGKGMFTDAIMGQVGKEMSSITNFGQVFGVTPGELQDPTTIVNKAQDAISTISV